jgi:hypothetical protein
MRNPTEGGVDDTSYIFANRRLERTKEAARYRPINNGRIKSPENEYRNRRERLLTPNFLLCEHCFWSASEVCRFRIDIWSECPICGHEVVISLPI